jgi:hypothetical protein
MTRFYYCFEIEEEKQNKVDMWSKKVAAFSKIIQNARYCVRMPPKFRPNQKIFKEREKCKQKSIKLHY